MRRSKASRSYSSGTPRTRSSRASDRARTSRSRTRRRAPPSRSRARAKPPRGSTSVFSEGPGGRMRVRTRRDGGVLARSSPSDPADVSASLVATLRRWEATRLERTSTAQIASFVSGSRSYGEAKFAEAMAESGIPEADLEAHRRTSLAERRAKRARRVEPERERASVRPRAGSGDGARATRGERKTRGRGGAGRRGTLAGAAAVFAFGDVWGGREPRGASAAEEDAEEDASSSSASFDSYVGDGFRFDLPRGWTVREDAPGASRSVDRSPLGVSPERGRRGGVGRERARVHDGRRGARVAVPERGGVRGPHRRRAARVPGTLDANRGRRRGARLEGVASRGRREGRAGDEVGRARGVCVS